MSISYDRKVAKDQVLHSSNIVPLQYSIISLRARVNYVKNDSQTSGLVLRNMKANFEGQLVLILLIKRY